MENRVTVCLCVCLCAIIILFDKLPYTIAGFKRHFFHQFKQIYGGQLLSNLKNEKKKKKTRAKSKKKMFLALLFLLIFFTSNQEVKICPSPTSLFDKNKPPVEYFHDAWLPQQMYLSRRWLKFVPLKKCRLQNSVAEKKKNSRSNQTQLIYV